MGGVRPVNLGCQILSGMHLDGKRKTLLAELQKLRTKIEEYKSETLSYLPEGKTTGLLRPLLIITLDKISALATSLS